MSSPRLITKTFYRLEVHSWAHGLAVEDHTNLDVLLEQLDDLLVGAESVTAAGDDRLDAVTRDGVHVHIVLRRYTVIDDEATRAALARRITKGEGTIKHDD